MTGEGGGGGETRPVTGRGSGGCNGASEQAGPDATGDASGRGKESATTVGISPACRSSAERVFRSALAGGVIGTMIVWGLLGLTQTVVAEGGMSFAGWAGRVVHDAILQKPGTKLIEAVYGEDEALNLRGDIRTLYVLGCLGIAGAFAGCLAGAGAGFLRRRTAGGNRTGTWAGAGAEAGSDGGNLPTGLPLGVAIMGLLYHGFVWGNVAVLLLAFSRRGRRFLTAATWIVGFAAVLLWAWALEINWPEGWSKTYPWARSLFFFVGHMVGAKE
ncbi:MAG: hypothetical protein N3A38_16445 [Planctomycetota bacterium]|nr:hypothetical protein [Planctomycetota bacterium]